MHLQDSNVPRCSIHINGAIHVNIWSHLIDETDVDTPSVTLVVDQAVYAKAVEVRASSSNTDLERIVLRMGAFHVVNTYIAVIRRYLDLPGSVIYW